MSKPSSTAALKQLSRQRSSLDKLPDVLAEINASSDRSVAIVLGSLVEDALRAVIMRQMPHLTKQEENELFEGFGPLSDFSAKIAICYGMKIIDKDLKSDLIRIEDIRNTFAHGFLGFSFNTEEIKEEIKVACNLLKIPTRWSEDGPMPARKQFISAILYLLNPNPERPIPGFSSYVGCP
jgi:DNA-binding MltR family transcriptional regulator